MKRIFAVLAMALLLVSCGGTKSCDAKDCCYIMSNDNMSVTIGKDGKLYSLRNEHTGHDYAAGEYLWRIYYDTHAEEEIQVLGEEQQVEVSHEGNTITLHYPSVKAHGKELKFVVTLKSRSPL